MQKIIYALILSIGYILLPIGFAYFLYFFNEMYSSFFKNNNPIPSILIYDSNNRLLKKYNSNITFNKIPNNLFHAFISIEDATFLSHYGISIKSIIRSVITNIKANKFVQGGSTITQQYIKLYYGDLKKTFYRKIKEIFTAIMIEIIHSKEFIFESYCNILYFGRNITGIANCSQTIFNKEYTELSLDECAMIAGIVQRPEHYNPIKNKAAAMERRNMVLKRMYFENYITKKEYEQNIKKETIIFDNNYFNANKSIFRIAENAIAQLNFPLHHEYEISTTINENIQRIAYYEFTENIKNLKKKCPAIDGSVIIINMENGNILSLIDGYDNISKNQNPFFWKKQIGSIIKPFVTYFALLNGDEINTIYDDIPLEDIFKWNPKNHYNKFYGPISLNTALKKSNNIVPIKILQKYDINKFIKIIQPFFENTIKPYYSIALGCMEADILEIGKLYYSFFSPNNKSYKKIYFINKIIKKCGGIIYEKEENSTNSYHFEESYTNQILNTLEEIGSNLAKKYNIKFQYPVYAKTGTTNDSVSCWFVCKNQKYLIIGCIGTHENTKLFQKYNITGSNSIAPLCLKIMKKIESINL